MILRVSSTAERGAIAVLAAASFLFLVFFGLRDAIAEYFAGEETRQGLSRAAQLEPGNPDHWFALGRYWQYNLENADLDLAVAAYRKALSVNPQSADAWLDLGASYEASGKLREAGDAFANAERVYPLSAQVAWSYGNFLLRQGELAAAFTEIHRAVAADPHRGGEAFSRCIRVEPDIDKVLDRVIPPSRDVYLQIVDTLAEGNQVADALRVWNRLVLLRPQLQLRSIRPLVDALRGAKDPQAASRVWSQAAALSGYANLSDLPGSVLWDGGFESGETGQTYTWNFAPNAHGVQIGVQSQEKHSGARALRVTFDGRSNPSFRDACHLGTVEPSTSYRFSAWVRARDLSTDQGVHFVIAGPGGAAALATKDVLGTTDWQQITADWASPAGSREVTVCLARLQSDQSDNKIRGTLWLDDVALVPVARGSAAP